jgi:hypothetical protein
MIDIWEDEWVPRNPSRKAIIAKGENLITKVRELIDPVTDNWDQRLIKQTFWSVDRRRIMAIPLTSFDMSNFVAWNLTETGTFLVRSAYYAEWDNQFGCRILNLHGVGVGFVA